MKIYEIYQVYTTLIFIDIFVLFLMFIVNHRHTLKQSLVFLMNIFLIVSFICLVSMSYLLDNIDVLNLINLSFVISLIVDFVFVISNKKSYKI